MKMFRVFLLGSLLAFLNPAWAEPVAIKSLKEMQGCWERINFSPEFSKIVNQQEHWPLPYQWFCFNKDGSAPSMMSTEYSKQTAASLRTTLSRLSHNPTYKFIKDGVIEMRFSQENVTLYWQVTLLNQTIQTPDGTPLPKGTMVMGLINPETSQVAYWRYLKPIK